VTCRVLDSCLEFSYVTFTAASFAMSLSVIYGAQNLVSMMKLVLLEGHEEEDLERVEPIVALHMARVRKRFVLSIVFLLVAVLVMLLEVSDLYAIPSIAALFVIAADAKTSDRDMRFEIAKGIAESAGADDRDAVQQKLVRVSGRLAADRMRFEATSAPYLIEKWTRKLHWYFDSLGRRLWPSAVVQEQAELARERYERHATHHWSTAASGPSSPALSPAPLSSQGAVGSSPAPVAASPQSSPVRASTVLPTPSRPASRRPTLAQVLTPRGAREISSKPRPPTSAGANESSSGSPVNAKHAKLCHNVFGPPPSSAVAGPLV